MNWLNTKHTLRAALLMLLVSGTSATSAHCSTDSIIEMDTTSNAIESVKETRYEKRMDRMHKNWGRLIPRYAKVQFAGNMGLLSLGTGWDYGKHHQWETDLLLGYLPKFSSKKAKGTITIKQNFIPWTHRNIGKGFSVDPLACGLYVNAILGDQFWISEPKRYPKSYYGFSTRIRFNIFLGQRLTYDIPVQHRFFARSVTFFYELSTSDLYLVSAVGNKYLRPSDYLSLSFGLKFQWL